MRRAIKFAIRSNDFEIMNFYNNNRQQGIQQQNLDIVQVGFSVGACHDGWTLEW